MLKALTPVEVAAVRLPEALAERVAPDAPAVRPGRFVVYWMRGAVRGVENPALDVALTVAGALGVPVVVYHRLPLADEGVTARARTFALEGVRAAQAQVEARGATFAFDLEGEPRGAALEALAAEASLVVTDALPLPWPRREVAWLAGLAPVWEVDAACVVPLWQSSAPPGLEALRDAWRQRLRRPWHDVASSGGPGVRPLPFSPVSLRGDEVRAVVGRCAVDFAVAPVQHTQGGAEAAMARWRRFVDESLDGWSGETPGDGVAALEADVAAGFLWAPGLLREVVDRGTDGARRFLRRLFWRHERGWHFCRWAEAPWAVESLPEAARAGLRACLVAGRGRGGAGPALSREALARGRTEDIAWDTAQRQLFRHGVVDAAVEASWCRALLGFGRDVHDAVSLYVDMHARYALGGVGPGRVGALLACLEARLPTPEVRFDVAWRQRVLRPARGQSLVVAVVGAGVAGAAAARTLVDAGHTVVAFEAAASPGGRLLAVRDGPRWCEVGAPCFSVNDARFARPARAWWREGLVTAWTPTEAAAEGTPRIIALPDNAAVAARLLAEVEVRAGTPVASLHREGGRWRLVGAGGASLGEYDALVVATQAPQAVAMVEAFAPALATRARALPHEAAWTALVGFSEAVEAVDVPAVGGGALARAWRESSKPAAGPGERWVLESSPTFAALHPHTAPNLVVAALTAAFFSALGVTPQTPTMARAQRWAFARVTRPLGEACLWDEGLRLAVCGDWCLGADVESAFLSGCAAGGRIAALPGDDAPEVEASLRHQLPLL